MEIVLRPIGVIRTNSSDDEVKNSDVGVPGIVEIYEEYEEGLEGIDGFSHLILITYLHKVTNNQKKVLKVRHRRLLRYGFKLEELPEVGVFCTDSPHRPVPVGLTIVKLIKRDGRFLHVENLDLFDGTPVLDIKPYTPDRVISNEELKFPEWFTKLYAEIKMRTGENRPIL
ncbi:MAG: tRNA (N6-threonylcarbamoyladenosine(37)-N6)-methyltransferase TrmO [Desulfurococcaceae archaeon TW002]